MVFWCSIVSFFCESLFTLKNSLVSLVVCFWWLSCWMIKCCSVQSLDAFKSDRTKFSCIPLHPSCCFHQVKSLIPGVTWFASRGELSQVMFMKSWSTSTSQKAFLLCFAIMKGLFFATQMVFHSSSVLTCFFRMYPTTFGSSLIAFCLFIIIFFTCLVTSLLLILTDNSNPTTRS